MDKNDSPDLYMDEKKDAQNMADLANGMKVVNTGMKIGQFWEVFELLKILTE